jgi:ubiquinone/menaquinone biosynthesis C-methylase UbiE
MNNGKYVETIYDPSIKPVTTYPDKLADYIIERFKIPEGSRILDNGCGRGDFQQAFKRNKHVMESWGVDISDVACKQDADYCISGIDLERDRLPFEDNYFDAVFTKSVLEHIHKPDHYLSECRRVLKPGGRIIVMVPDWHTQMYIFYDDFSHVQPYTKLGVKDTLKVFGFHEAEAEVFYQLPSVWKYPSVKVICKILQLFGPVKKMSKNKFYRFSRELMILGVGTK